MALQLFVHYAPRILRVALSQIQGTRKMPAALRFGMPSLSKHPAAGVWFVQEKLP
jgi:hypothetical protein